MNKPKQRPSSVKSSRTVIDTLTTTEAKWLMVFGAKCGEVASVSVKHLKLALLKP
jgi:hypothetical protein